MDAGIACYFTDYAKNRQTHKLANGLEIAASTVSINYGYSDCLKLMLESSAQIKHEH